MILYFICGAVVLGTGFFLFKLTNDAHCVDLSSGLQFNRSLIPTKAICEENKLTWVYEPIVEDPKKSKDPLLQQKINKIVEMRRQEGSF